MALPLARDNSHLKNNFMNNMVKNYFSGQTLVIASMHGKEKVLKPLFESLGVKVVVTKELNTDDFGTFSGEVERPGSALETARKKCRLGAQLTGESLVLASEGSFGAHPVLGFVPANEELLVLSNLKTGWEIRAKVISTQTNFAGNDYTDWEDLLFFAATAGFPSHGLIVRAAKDDYTEIHKGIRDWDKLKASFQYFRKRSGHVYVETDMRAHLNPTRLKVIREAGEKLLSVIQNTCPVCEGPGFAVREVVKGLPCGQCNTPTQTAKAHVYFCQHCGHTEKNEFPEKKRKEDPMFCEDCNP